MISAIVLTRNDAQTIEKCLASLSWCDEVMVIDDNSKDKTCEIAKKAGAKVLSHALNDDFAEQRNFALSEARGEWVFFVDSDEVVTPQLGREIKEALKASENPYNGYYFHRIDWWGGRWLRHGETGNVKLLRLAKKDMGRWARPIHEEWRVNGPLSEFANPLEHYPHPDVAQFLAEINQYSTLNARFLKSQGIVEPAWYVVGKPLAKFFMNFIVRRGFLDGTQGAIYAIMMSFHSFLVRAKLKTTA